MHERRTIETYPELAGWYDAKYREMHGGWVTPADECNKHLDDLGVQCDGSKWLLDIGCGAGHFLEQAAKRTRCVGIDISAEVLKHARERLYFSGTKLAVANIETLEGPAQFDYIVSLGSLEHVLEIGTALESIRRLLKPDGKWYFFCPNEKWKHKDQPNERTMTCGEWCSLFVKHGLVVLKAHEWNDSTAFTGTVSIVAVLEERMRRAARGDDIGPTSEITFDASLLGPKQIGPLTITAPALAQWDDLDTGPEPSPVFNFIEYVKTDAFHVGLPPFDKPWEKQERFSINLGSGQRPFPKPWINVDCQPKWKPDIVADGANLKEHFADGSAETIVLQHTLEHYGCGEADAMLKECYRVLRPGGSLIVTVPDMRALCDQWLHGDALDTQLFMTNVYGAYMGDDADRHRWGFDVHSLLTTLYEMAEWSQVPLFDYRHIPGADIAKAWWILGIEAVK